MKNGIYTETFINWIHCKVHYKDDIIFHIEFPNGTQNYINHQGKLHRLDGPASIYTNGDKYWCLNGNWIKVNSQEEFENHPEYKEYIKLEKLRAFE